MIPDPHSTGVQGEEVAARFLLNRGYAILERNFRGERSEIDIIARTGDIIVFCEVKTARSRRFGPAVSWVTPRKVRRIVHAAGDYLATHDVAGCSFRFDVIGLEVGGDGAVSVNHIPDAFSAPPEEP